MKWGSEGEGDGQLSKPESSIVDSQGNVYVADYGNDRIQKFTNDLQVQLQVLEYDL
jgi:NHL repeat